MLSYAANERTFLHWMNMSVTIGSISAALLGMKPRQKAHSAGLPFADLTSWPYRWTEVRALHACVQVCLHMPTRTGASNMRDTPSLYVACPSRSWFSPFSWLSTLRIISIAVAKCFSAPYIIVKALLACSSQVGDHACRDFLQWTLGCLQGQDGRTV